MPSAGSQRIAKVVIVFTFFRAFFADGTNVRKNVVKPLCVWIYCWSSGEKSLYLPVVFPTDGSGNTFTRRPMKSLLYQELRDLARRILDTPEQDLSSLQGQARVLYEKLTVLRYTDGLLEELRETLEDQTPPHPLAESPALEQTPAAASPAFPQDASGEKEVPQPAPEFSREEPNISARETPVEEPAKKNEETIASAPKSPATASTGGKSSSGKSRGKDFDEFQQSLFGEDFFTQELNFDPDEELFEELPVTPPSPSPSLDPEGPLPEETPSAAPSLSLDPEGPLPEETPSAAPSPSQEPKETPSAAPSPSLDPEGPLPEEASAAAPSPSLDPEGPLPEETPSAAPSPSLDPEGPLPEETPSAASSPSLDPEGPLPEVQEMEEKPLEESVEVSFSGEQDKESEGTTSFFSFQVIREEEEVSSDDEGSLSAQSVVETMEEGEPAGEGEVSSEQLGTVIQPEEAAEVPSRDDAIDMQPQEEPQSEAPVVPVEPESSPKEEEPRPTINEVAAEKEQARRPSLNEILARSNVRMDMNDRIAFINNLFDGDAEAFEASVRYIFSLTDLDVANEYIIEILKPSYNNWFEKEKYERRFSEIVLHHFIEQEKRR